MPSRRDGIFYMASFGFGSIAGMALASVLLSIPIALLGIGAPRAARLARAVSLASVVFGVLYGATTLAAALSGRGLS